MPRRSAAEFAHSSGAEAAADAFLVICTAADAVSVEEVFDPPREKDSG